MKYLGPPQSRSRADLTASHNRGGQYYRERVTPSETPSTRRTLLWDAMADISPRWSTDLTDRQRADWTAVAPEVRDTLGEGRVLSGQQTFMRAQLLRSLGGLPFSADVPSRSVVTFTALSLVESAGALRLSWSASGPSSAQIFLQGAFPQNAGVRFVSTWRQFYLIGIGSAQPLNIAAGYAIDFGGAPPSGSRVWVRGRVVGESGLDITSRLVASVLIP